MHDYDRTSKWLIQHHGDAILRLAGVADVVSWRPLQAELVQPRQLPDGLIEARRAGRDEPDLFVLDDQLHFVRGSRSADALRAIAQGPSSAPKFDRNPNNPEGKFDERGEPWGVWNPALIGLILGIDRILDMCRTTLNVTGDITAAVYVARSEGFPLLDEAPARS